MIFNFQYTRVSSGVIYSVFPNFICNCREESINEFPVIEVPELSAIPAKVKGTLQTITDKTRKAPLPTLLSNFFASSRTGASSLLPKILLISEL
jgi:hypothetical protein